VVDEELGGAPASEHGRGGLRCGPIREVGRRTVVLTVNGGRRRHLGEIWHRQRSSGRQRCIGGQGGEGEVLHALAE
jgi:hypothetical protein